MLGNEGFLATCGCWFGPPAEVRWLTGASGRKSESNRQLTHHTNGTTTTISSLFEFTKEINRLCGPECVVTNPALSKKQCPSLQVC
ncbi:nectin-1-like isoform X1, partial [Lates japonicus]